MKKFEVGKKYIHRLSKDYVMCLEDRGDKVLIRTKLYLEIEVFKFELDEI